MNEIKLYKIDFFIFIQFLLAEITVFGRNYVKRRECNTISTIQTHMQIIIMTKTAHTHTHTENSEYKVVIRNVPSNITIKAPLCPYQLIDINRDKIALRFILIQFKLLHNLHTHNSDRRIR